MERVGLFFHSFDLKEKPVVVAVGVRVVVQEEEVLGGGGNGTEHPV